MGVVSPSQSNAGDLITAAAINGPVNQLAAVINGGIDATNIADGSITTSKLSSAIGTALAGGYTPLLNIPATVIANGNRSYTCVFNSVDLTSSLSPGMRIRTTRTVAAPTQCTLLNGSTQYWSKSAPAGMTFTNNYATGMWVKPTSYQDGVIQSRFNGTSGWRVYMMASGQIQVNAFNAGAANQHTLISAQSIPLNKWVHIATQQDMTNTTNDSLNNYIMIDGVNVPVTITRGGTNPVALVQAGNYEIGSCNGGTVPFPGKISQAALFSAKVTQATMQSYISQGLLGTETSLVSAYSFNGNSNDLNTTNANNLTANGSVVATAADSPFGGQAGGSISSTLDYGIVQTVSFSSNTTVVIQVAEGCTVPTIGGVSAVAYAGSGVPFGFPRQKGKWTIITKNRSTPIQASPTIGTWYNIGNISLNIPIGSWDIQYSGNLYCSNASATSISPYVTLSTSINSETDSDTSYRPTFNPSGTGSIGAYNGTTDADLSVATTYYKTYKIDAGSPSNLQEIDTLNYIKAVNAYL